METFFPNADLMSSHLCFIQVLTSAKHQSELTTTKINLNSSDNLVLEAADEKCLLKFILKNQQI